MEIKKLSDLELITIGHECGRYFNNEEYNKSLLLKLYNNYFNKEKRIYAMLHYSMIKEMQDIIKDEIYVRVLNDSLKYDVKDRRC